MVLKINGQQSPLFWKIKGSWESVCVVNSDASTSIPSAHVTERCHTNELAGKTNDEQEVMRKRLHGNIFFVVTCTL